MDGQKHFKRKNPQKNANFLSRIFFCFMNPFMWHGYRKGVQEEDLFETLPSDESEKLCNELTKYWEREQKLAAQKGRPPSLFRTLVRLFGPRLGAFGFLLLIEECARLMQPFFIGGLIRYFRFDQPLTENEALFYASGLVLCAALYPLIHHPYFLGLQRIGMQMRIANCGLIFQKGLRLSSSALHKTTVGHVVNLLSNDVARFDFCCMFLHYLWVAPIMLFAYGAFLWYELGASCLAGFGAIFILMPIQGFFSSQMGKCRRKVAVRSDKRIGIMSEILNAIRVIKMYAWEGAFSELVDKVRTRELRIVRLGSIWQGLIIAFFWASGQLVILCAVIAYILSGNDLTAERVFVAAALFNSCRLPITLFVPLGLQFMFETKVTINRIQAFLLLDEHEGAANRMPKQLLSAEDLAKSGRSDDFKKKQPVSDPILEVKNYSATWNLDQETYAVKNFNFSAKPGQIVAIIGPVGSGKSSILNSILGETHRTEGEMIVKGTIGYVPQDAWVFSATLKQNVLFGLDYDKNKYQKAIQVCALKKDLTVLPNGDLTLVGDRGITLSGGQKARVNLARAVYREPDIYLFDDPLSAVDAAVGRYLFEKCIKAHLSDKIRILVTHQLQYLREADRVILVKDGQMVANGTFDELQKMGEKFTEILRETEESYRRDSVGRQDSVSSGRSRVGSDDVHSPSKSPLTPSSTSTPKKRRPHLSENEGKESEKLLENGTLDGSLLQVGEKSLSESAWSLAMGQPEMPSNLKEEERSIGAVDAKVYFGYIRAMGSCCKQLIVFFLVLLGQIVFNSADWWLNIWTTEAEREKFYRELNATKQFNASTPQTTIATGLMTEDFMFIYIGLISFLICMSVARTVTFRMAQVDASRKLHAQMFQAVVRSKVAFFDNNPVGRILNRFSKDTGAMDERLSFTFFDFISGALQFTAVVIVVGVLNPFVFIPTVPLAFLFFCIRRYYLKTSRDVKRLEATTRSPVFSHVTATLQGLTSIRAFGADQAVLANFHAYQNVHTSSFCIQITSARWFAVVIDWMVVAYISIVAFVCILTGSGLLPGAVGLILFYSVGLMRFFGRFIEGWARLEVEMVSVERILEYGRLESEPELESKSGSEPPADWPDKGEINIDNLSLKYETEGQYVLKNISCLVEPSAKIGIVGRTGAGKSSLLKALFRMAEFEGQVKIDNIDITTVGLHDLRKRISIIPQDPVLFIGTLRENLDPFGDYKEEQLWAAIEQVELKSAVTELAQGLDTHMQEGGANLSVGQRQLVCLARALLKHCKILVIDEATANVDHQTDALIQETLRHRFSDCTVLTIAHRLNTIMDSNKVMVFDSGILEEFDEPYILLENSESLFSKLVEETGEANAKLLKKLAEEAYKMRKNETQ